MIKMRDGLHTEVRDFFFFLTIQLNIKTCKNREEKCLFVAP